MKRLLAITTAALIPQLALTQDPEQAMSPFVDASREDFPNRKELIRGRLQG